MNNVNLFLNALINCMIEKQEAIYWKINNWPAFRDHGGCHVQANSREVRRILEGARRYIVPLFQRPYVWGKDEQWQPLLEDLKALAERVELSNEDTATPHFLGAIVLDQPFFATGDIETRLVIDGQQRLTTLQILLEVVYDIAVERDHQKAPALKELSRNSDHVCERHEDRFKVWPTNVDQSMYRTVMDATNPSDLLKALDLNINRMWAGNSIADCYLFFHREIVEWLDEEPILPDDDRLERLYRALTRNIRIVVIDLEKGDDAQLIFETLNARGTPLLPADLVKNLLFNKARRTAEKIEHLYEDTWKKFDDHHEFWRSEIGRGHARRAHLDLLLMNYLSAVTEKEVPVTHLYASYVKSSRERDLSAREELEELVDYATIYKRLMELEPDSPEGVFIQRLEALDIRVLHPFLIELFRNHHSDRECIVQVLRDLESFLVRRMVCQLTTRGYGRFFIDLIPFAKRPSTEVQKYVREHLLSSEAAVGRWPDDDEFKKSWLDKPVYDLLARGRIRMLLYALAKPTKKDDIGTLKQDLSIEHIMPQAWRSSNWPIEHSDNPQLAGEERDSLLHSMGNLTLVTQELNSSMANKDWESKRKALDEHASLPLNRELLRNEKWKNGWDEATIHDRAEILFESAQVTWPHPKGDQ